MNNFAPVGQWVGTSVGEPSGRLVVDLEAAENNIIGHAYLFSDPPELFSVAAELKFPIGQHSVKFKANIYGFDARTGYVLSKQDIQSRFPDQQISDQVNIKFEFSDTQSCTATWDTQIGTYGKAELVLAAPPKKSIIPPEPNVQNWQEFREKISAVAFRERLFRGQRNQHPLSTSFHRTKRKLLTRYLNEDVQVLHRELTGKTNHLFDLNKPQELGAFLNLAQHHGFPTPLLDWTYSPFVAAWFAYSEIGEHSDEKPVRIFEINRRELLKMKQFQNLTFVPPHFSILETLAIENDRATPQQGVLTLTNVHDIERQILNLEEILGQKIITAYDLTKTDADEALNDLAMMGITRSTIFPGIESICADLKQRLFN
ncbi:MAG: FRG domain-containing protein [Marinosulfonomonas sp.]|nr:FRG domain-containing protein [Marinosulfonomonas sp.]